MPVAAFITLSAASLLFKNKVAQQQLMTKQCLEIPELELRAICEELKR